MNIQKKLLISFLSLICLFVIGDFIKIQAIQNTTENFNEVVSRSTPAVIILNEISASFARIREEAISGALIISTLQNLTDSALVEEEKENQQEEQEEFEESYQILKEAFVDYENLANQPEQQKFLQQLSQSGEKTFELGQILISEETSLKAIIEAKTELEEREEEFLDIINQALAFEVSKFNQGTQQVEEASGTLLLINLITTIVTGGLALLLAILLTRRIAHPMRDLSNAAIAVGEGQLEQKIEVNSSDEVGILANAFNQMVRNLKETTVSKNYVDDIIKAMADTLIVLDSEGRIQTVNPATLNLLGYREKELIGQFAHQVLLDEHLPHQMTFDDLLSQEVIERVETIYLAKDTLSIPVLFSSAPIDNQRTSGGYVWVARDITERKEAEAALASVNQELMKARDELEARVEARTLELGQANQQLIRARDGLEKRVSERTAELAQANRDLETMLYVISHDLKEPLRAIHNFSNLIKRRYAKKLDTKGQDFLQRIVRASDRMRTLLDDILLLSRAQRMDQAGESVSGEEVVHAALERLERKINESQAKIDIAPNLPWLEVNKTWATEAVYNLISNGLKYTNGNSPPEIEIAPYYDEDEQLLVGIVVKDRGPGVEPEYAERIFQLFQRGVGREIEGTGAGLAIVRQIAERHGGSAWVQAREAPAGGSEFIITFRSTKKKPSNALLNQ